MSSVVLPSREDPVVRAASGLIGGPVGRHARPGGRRWPVGALLLLTLGTCLLGFVQKAPCRTHAWSHEYQYTRLCYSDVFALYFAEHLNEGKVPYADWPVEYPVVIGGVMYVAAEVAHLAPAAARNRLFFDVTAALLTLCALLTTWAVIGLAGQRRPWDAALFVLAPALVLHAFTNWDLVAVALATAGLLMWARSRPLLAGVLLGLGIATKLYPVLFFVPLAALSLRARRPRPLLVAAGAAAVAWAAVDVPIWAAYPTSFTRFWTLNRERGADWDSLWLGLEHLRGQAASLSVLNAGVAAATLLVLVGVVALALLAPRPPRLAALTFLLVAGFLLVNKVDSPQYVLWLLPLAALARPRWPAFLVWQATEALLLFFRFYHFVMQDKPGQGITYAWFAGSVLLRDAALIVMMGLVVWEALRPDYDAVRRGGTDDPAWPAATEKPVPSARVAGMTAAG